nr:VENN motif pre-toxin domain-containing protein [Moraxella sp. Tifton1]
MANYLYGTKYPETLSQGQKDTITSILNLATATAIYTTTDGSTTDAVSGAEIGKVGVENNNYTWTAENFGMTISDINHGIAKMERCQANPSASDCQPRKDYLGDYARNVVNNATSGINTTTSVEASGMALFGFSQSRGIATDIKGNTCTVDATCFLLGPRVGGSASLNQELATGNLTPGEKYYSMSIDGAIIPIAGAKGNVSLYSNGSVGYHGGASSGADFGLAIKACSVQTEKECK